MKIGEISLFRDVLSALHKERSIEGTLALLLQEVKRDTRRKIEALTGEPFGLILYSEAVKKSETMIAAIQGIQLSRTSEYTEFLQLTPMMVEELFCQGGTTFDNYFCKSFREAFDQKLKQVCEHYKLKTKDEVNQIKAELLKKFQTEIPRFLESKLCSYQDDTGTDCFQFFSEQVKRASLPHSRASNESSKKTNLCMSLLQAGFIPQGDQTKLIPEFQEAIKQYQSSFRPPALPKNADQVSKQVISIAARLKSLKPSYTRVGRGVDIGDLSTAFANDLTLQTPPSTPKAGPTVDGLRPIQLKKEAAGKGRDATPYGTDMFPLWEIEVEEKGKKGVLKIYADQVDEATAEKIPLGDKGATPEKLITKTAPRRNDSLIAVLRPEQPIEVSGSRSQVAVMKGSPNETALAAGYKADKKDNAFQWCHVIAHSLGGAEFIKSVGEFKEHINDPQKSENMVLGTAQANAQMYAIEACVKYLVDVEKQTLAIIGRVKYVFGKEAYALASQITYIVTNQAMGREISLTFNMLSRRQMAKNEIQLLAGSLVTFFKKGLEAFKDDLLQNSALESVEMEEYPATPRELNFSDSESKSKEEKEVCESVSRRDSFHLSPRGSLDKARKEAEEARNRSPRTIPPFSLSKGIDHRQSASEPGSRDSSTRERPTTPKLPHEKNSAPRMGYQ